MWTAILNLVTLVWGFFFPAKDQREEERQDGERLGQAETSATISKEELSDAKKAVDAARDAGARDDAGGVRDQHSGDQPWNPDGLG